MYVLYQIDNKDWKNNLIASSLVMGPGQFFVARVGLGQVSHLWFGFEFGKFPLKESNFSIFFSSGQKNYLRVGSESTRVKGKSASYLLRVKSKLGLGWVRAHCNSFSNYKTDKMKEPYSKYLLQVICN